MHRVFLSIVIVATILLSTSCNHADNVAKSNLTNLKDSASYAMGIMLAQQYLDEQMDSLLDRSLTINGITDLMKHDTTLLTHDEATAAIEDYTRYIIDTKYSKNIQIGKDFMAENLANTGVMQTANGMQYSVIKEGNGKVHPSVSDQVLISLEGTKIDGTVFGTSGDKPAVYDFGSLPRGLVEGILLMTPGAKYKFVLPYYLAFGENGYQNIEPYSTVIFTVELFEIIKH
ncbi:MAG: FKBP-type peptidyl-prolyl cis-trans isomerase [Bacteroidales bacterium]|nr:FKBP-type peptidyl-prolyl cis-trans isomerase [Bacteroidales bacterium]